MFKKKRFQLLLFAFLLAGLTFQFLPAQFGPYVSRGLGGGGALFHPSISPHNPSEYYVNCDMNNLFHSTDAGVNWDNVNFREIIPTVESPIQFSSNPLRRYGLEKRFIQNYTNILTSVDGGLSWDTLPSPAGVQAQFVLLSNPQRDSVWLINSSNSIYFTSNDGASYNNIYTSSVVGDCHLAGAFFDGPNYYICTNRGLLSSTNAGQSWSAPFTTGINLGNEEIYSFAGAKTGNGIRFVAVTAGPTNVTAGVKPSALIVNSFKNIWGFTVGQSTWTSHASGLQFPQYDKPMLVSMARNDTATVYLGGYCKIWNFQAHTVFKSTNGGRQWTNTFVRADIVQPYDSTNAMNNNFIQPGWFGYSAANNQSSWWTVGQVPGGLGTDPNNSANLMIMNTSALHLSTDGGSTWKQKYLNPAQSLPSGQTIPANATFSSSGLENTGSWDMVWADSLNIMAGFNDVLATRSTDGGHNWSFDYSGLKQATNPTGNHKDVGQLIKHPVSGVLYAAAGTTLGQGGLYIDAYTDPRIGSVMFSTDMGYTWASIKNFQHVVSAICLDPSNPNRMYAAVCNSAASGYPGAIYVTQDITQGAAAVWDTLAIPAGTEGRPNFIEVLSDGALVAGYGARDIGGNAFNASSGVFYSTDNGASWSLRAPTAMQYSVRSVTIDPNDSSDSTWWACTHAVGNANAQAGLWRSFDRGQNWTQIMGNSISMTTISFDPLVPNTAWLGTERNGLYHLAQTNSPNPAISPMLDFPHPYAWKACFNPYDLGEMWITSFGNGLRVSNCSMVDPGIASLSNICNDDAPVDLFQLLGQATAGGTWSDLNASGGLSGNVFDPSLANPGLYSFKYVVGTGRCIDSTTISIAVNAVPIVTFSGLDSVYCNGSAPSLLVGSPSGGTFSGAGMTGNSFDPNQVSPGQTFIDYNFTDTNGCDAMQTQSSTVYADATSQFTYSPNALTVAFTDQSSNSTQWNWDFGDLGTSTQQNPTHTYTAQGTYSVCLTVSNVACIDSSCQAVLLMTTNALVANGTDWELWPNPGSDQCLITHHFQGSTPNVSILDAKGSIIAAQTHSMAPDKFMVDTRLLPAGLYFIGLLGDNGWQWRKWVKE